MICKGCGTTFEGRKRRFCTGVCRHRWYRLHWSMMYKRERRAAQVLICKGCGEVFTTCDGRQRYCTVACRVEAQRSADHAHTCEKCGKGFNSHYRAHRFCSRRCMPRSRSAKRHTCQQCGVVFRPKRAEYSDFCSRACYFRRLAARKKAPPLPWRRIQRCAVCGVVFLTGRAARYVCGEECRQQAASAKQEAARVRPCVRGCGRMTSGYWVKMCSKCKAGAVRAQRKASKVKRRIQLKGARVELVDPQAVFERDGWKCGICGRAVNRRAVVPHDGAPTLDHVVPLSKGGEHSMKNVQCAHFLCNSRKGSRDGGQLRLFG